MFTFLITRDGKAHIVDFYHPPHSRYRTVCGNVYYKKQYLITLAAGNTFPGICKNCKNTYDDLYLSDLNHIPQMAHGQPYRLQDFLEFNKAGLFGPEEDYILPFKRIWGKLNKYKNLANRNRKFYG